MVGLISLIFIFKKKLEELKSISYVFLLVVFLFIVLLYFELVRDKDHVIEPWDQIKAVEVDYHLLTAFSIFFFAYSYQFMIFPAYVELEDASTFRFEQASAISIIIYTVTLVSTGIVSVLLFGGELKPDLLDNVATRKNGVSIFLRVIYCIILLFHLPYIFFTLKEYTMVMYDEYKFKHMSEHLKNKQKAELNQSTDNDQNNMLIAAGSKGEGQEESEPLLDEEKNMTDLEGKREDDVDSAHASNYSDLTYKKLSEWEQDVISFILHALILISAILIKDISDVFDFAGTIGCSFI